MNTPKSFHCGFVSIIGEPNVGKSTLLNKLVGSKISIISKKPQTTRVQITGIRTDSNSQIIFVDTPGLNLQNKSALNRILQSESLTSFDSVDIILYMITPKTNLSSLENQLLIRTITNSKKHAIILINKIDLIDRRELLPLISNILNLKLTDDIIPISATKSDGLDIIIEKVKSKLPVQEKPYPDDIISDKPENFIVSEIIREKIFEFTHKELPYSTVVRMDSVKEEKNLIKIQASIIVDRDSQKGIIIGNKGSHIKMIGTAARKDIEDFFGKKVFLELKVILKAKWTKDSEFIKEHIK